MSLITHNTKIVVFNFVVSPSPQTQKDAKIFKYLLKVVISSQITYDDTANIFFYYFDDTNLPKRETLLVVKLDSVIGIIQLNIYFQFPSDVARRIKLMCNHKKNWLLAISLGYVCQQHSGDYWTGWKRFKICGWIEKRTRKEVHHGFS